MTIDWEEYLDVPPASDADIARVEHTLGVTLPDDFRDALRRHQGRLPTRNVLHADAMNPVTFGPLLHVSSTADGYAADYEMTRVAAVWRRLYPKVVPIADNGGGSCFAYDYAAGERQPPIVFLNHEAEPTDPAGKIRVADSFTELLAKLREQ